jgi:hypothetical protein
MLTNKLIFSRGYSDLFDEWQTTDEAKHSKTRYHECILFPSPKNKIILDIFKRDSTQSFIKIFTTSIDPASDTIYRKPSPETISREINHAAKATNHWIWVFSFRRDISAAGRKIL